MSTISAADRTPLESVQALWDRLSTSSPVYGFFFDGMEITAATYGWMSAKITVNERMVNSKGGLHGSVSATIVDWAGGMAIASTGALKTGVSTDIHVSYVSTANEGDVLSIEATVNKVGRNLAYTDVKIYKRKGDRRSVVASGSHTKYIMGDPGDQ